SGMDRLTDTEVERFFAEMRNNEGPAFLDEKEQLLLVTMRMRVSGSTAFLELRELLKEKIPRMLPHLSVSFTGGQVLTSESANNIAQGQIQSVFLALAVIFVILSSLFLSWKMGVIALFPNIVAVLIFFGTMGWLSIPIGVTISVIAAIALGIGVDDTIHFLSHYNETAKHLRDKREASMATLPHVVRPMILTTIALSAGFILFVLSDMESQILFGTLTAFTLVVCLATDMTFLPSVVMETGMITVWDYVGLKFNKEFVQKIDLFKNMSVREAKIATLMSFTVDLKEDEVLFRQGDMGREMFVVLDGQIRIYLEQGYETTELALLEKGTTFGEMGLFRGAQRSAGAVASQASKMLVINHDSLIRLRKRNPKIAAKLFLNLAMRLENSYRQTNQKILDGLVKSENFGTDLKGRFNRKFTDLFSDISEKNQKKWIQSSTRIPMTAEGILDAIELDQNSWLLMLSGKIEIRCSREESYQQLAIRNAGDLLCRAEMLVPTEHSKIELHALEASEILCISAEQLEMLQHKEVRLTAQWTEELVCVLSDQVEEANTYLKFTV
ncbi:MAG: cyclic nucleotide-binding domain-containing protein, partial [SAR324 cluster bacterium]|nr:cyclic nucleotide-binding domain-containing protein [SAR324 cluster bacterium]